jgi:uncharacterized protein (TIGR03435 family)
MKYRIARRLAIALTAVMGLAIARSLPGQSQAETKDKAPLAFDVTSVKPSLPGVPGIGIQPMSSGQGYRVGGVPVRLMIKLMYKVTDSQIVGGPKWMDTDLWDIEAKADHKYTLDQLHEMFQTMLADRFKLQFHKEKKDLPAYVLSIDKSGSKLKVNESLDTFEIPIKPGRMSVGPAGIVMNIIGTRVPMIYFTWNLSQTLRDDPVVDETGLTGFYDFKLEWLQELPPGMAERAGAMPPGGPPAPDNAPTAPPLAVALREQLGLKLEKRKAPVEVFMIDRVEKAEAN